MRIQEKSRKKIIIVAALLAVALISGGIYAYSRHGSNSKSDDSSSEEVITKEKPKGTSANNNNQPTEDEKDSTLQYEGNAPNDNTGLTGVINYKSVVDGNLVVRVTIDQVVTSGSCTLTLSHSSGGIVTRVANITQNPSSSTCEGFDVPLADLLSGSWNISVQLSGDNKSGTITGDITI